MPRSTPRLVALLLAASALTGCAAMTGLSGAPKDVAVRDKPQPQKTVANDVEGNLRQARLLREAGSYDEAIHILSQLMLAAADHATARGARRLIWAVFKPNRLAYDFYHRLGAERIDDLDWMTLSLEPGRPG